MKYLLDTHTFLWLNGMPTKLSGRVRGILASEEHRFFLSIVSPWEIQIKQQLGKLHLEQPLSTILAFHLSTQSLSVLPIELIHIEVLGTLDPYHRDPFDRMLIAQAMSEGMSIISADQAFFEYPVEELDLRPGLESEITHVLTTRGQVRTVDSTSHSCSIITG